MIEGTDDLPTWWREWYEERAGMLEYEADYERPEAEALAWRMTLRGMFRAR